MYCNTSKREHGGICIFFHYEHDVYVCFSYIPTQYYVYFNLHPSGFFENVETGISKYSDLGEVLWMGDLNARCGNTSDVLHDCDRYTRFIHTLESKRAK